MTNLVPLALFGAGIAMITFAQMSGPRSRFRSGPSSNLGDPAEGSGRAAKLMNLLGLALTGFAVLGLFGVIGSA